MKVLFVSRYVDPNPIGGNSNVYRQAKALHDDFGLDLEILTWPDEDLWTGPVPAQPAAVPALQVVREGLTYHVFTAPPRWNAMVGGSVLEPDVWEAAVGYGERLLTSLKPEIMHLQHRHGLWWLLDAAQRLNIPTFYTNHDWGLACLRTMFVMGDGALCDGEINPEKCAQCIVTGRGRVGTANELLVQNALGRALYRTAEKTAFGDALRARNAVSRPARERTRIQQARVARVLGRLHHLFTPSQFGQRVFMQFGLPADRITVLPWYHSPVQPQKTVTADQPFTITFIGRVSPEKGVHLILAALEEIGDTPPMQLRITGSNDSAYCTELRKKYPARAGATPVEWLGWTSVDPLFNDTDVTIVPSAGVDNTPLSLIESLAYQVPVVATRIPPVAELVTEGQNAFLADFMSVPSLAAAIRRAAANKDAIRAGKLQFPTIMTLHEYLQHVVRAYEAV